MSSPSLPSTMRAIVADKPGGADVLSYRTSEPLPKVKPDDILVHNRVAGINYIDTYFRTGLYPAPFPLIGGREAAGTIVEIGSAVPAAEWGLKVGDRVAWNGTNGAYAEYTAVPSFLVVKIPDESITDEVAAGGLLMGMTALSLTQEAYEVKKGDTVLIHAAAGGTGLLLTQVAKAKGATVIGTAGGPEKCKIAKDNGVDHVVDYKQHTTKEQWLPEVLKLTKDGQGVDAVFDGVGKDTFDGTLDVVKRKGTIVIFGASSGPPPAVPLPRLTAKNSKLLRPTMSNYTVTREEVQHYADGFFEYIRTGKMKINFHKTYQLEDLRTAHEDLQGRKTSGKLSVKL